MRDSVREKDRSAGGEWVGKRWGYGLAWLKGESCQQVLSQNRGTATEGGARVFRVLQ